MNVSSIFFFSLGMAVLICIVLLMAFDSRDYNFKDFGTWVFLIMGLAIVGLAFYLSTPNPIFTLDPFPGLKINNDITSVNYQQAEDLLASSLQNSFHFCKKYENYPQTQC